MFKHPSELTPAEMAAIDQSVAWTNNNLDTAVAAVAEHLALHAEPVEGVECWLPCIGPVSEWLALIDRPNVHKLLVGALRRLAQEKIEKEGTDA